VPIGLFDAQRQYEQQEENWPGSRETDQKIRHTISLRLRFGQNGESRLLHEFYDQNNEVLFDRQQLRYRVLKKMMEDQ
jgi:hypothetical protein